MLVNRHFCREMTKSPTGDEVLAFLGPGNLCGKIVVTTPIAWRKCLNPPIGATVTPIGESGTMVSRQWKFKLAGLDHALDIIKNDASAAFR